MTPTPGNPKNHAKNHALCVKGLRNCCSKTKQVIKSRHFNPKTWLTGLMFQDLKFFNELITIRAL